jgi:hypothetical protein
VTDALSQSMGPGPDPGPGPGPAARPPRMGVWPHGSRGWPSMSRDDVPPARRTTTVPR